MAPCCVRWHGDRAPLTNLCSILAGWRLPKLDDLMTCLKAWGLAVLAGWRLGGAGSLLMVIMMVVATGRTSNTLELRGARRIIVFLHYYITMLLYDYV